jgi:tetratricopeptide (TPR) repeat protein
VLFFWLVPIRKSDIGLAALLLAVTLVAYWPAVHGGILWDDNAHITQPELQSFKGLGRIWFDLGATQQYYPLLHSAFWVEHRLWGDSTLGYHILNVVLHSISACLFGLILTELSISGAWIGAFIFALHPVSVESVAWISEQKNTLSGVLYLLAMFLYLRNDEGTARSESGRSRFTAAYIISLMCFAAAVLSKSVTATLPAALLVILWLKRGKLEWKRDVLPLLPWFAIGIGGGLFTAWVERRFIGAAGNDFSFGFLQRVLIAGRAVSFYLSKLLWPSNLMFMYPRWEVKTEIWWQYLFPAGVAALLYAAWLIRGKTRGPLAALLFFVGSLFPALGFFNVFPFIYSFVANHFQYLAGLGIIALAAGSCRAKWNTAVAAVAIGGLGILTWLNCSKYADAATLYRATIQQNPNCWMCYNNLGVIYFQQGRIQEAMQDYEEAARLNPEFSDALDNLAFVLIDLGRSQEAIPYLQRAFQSIEDKGAGHLRFGAALLKMNRVDDAITRMREGVRLKPKDADGHAMLGAALQTAGHLPQARTEFEEALRLKPDSPSLHSTIGDLLLASDRPDEAIAQFEAALRIDPNFVDAHRALAKAYSAKARSSDAAAHYEEALRIKANQPAIHNDLALVFENLKRPQDAVDHFQEAIRLDPGFVDAHYNLGLLFAALGRRDDAINEFKASLRYSPNYAEAHDALGAALFESGQFKEAVAEFTETERLKPDLAGVRKNLEIARRAATVR